MKKLTEIIVVLDRSGSMDAIKHETIEGFNSFLREQKTINGKARLTLVQFDHEYEVLYLCADLKGVVPLTTETYKPRGSTALLDAIGKTITETSLRINFKKNAKKEIQVIFVIITDGHDNESIRYGKRQIFDMIRSGEDKDRWDFVYLGANQDAIEEASHLGIRAYKAMTFASDDDGARNMFFDLSINIAEMRRCSESEFKFKDEQRTKQKR